MTRKTKRHVLLGLGVCVVIAIANGGQDDKPAKPVALTATTTAPQAAEHSAETSPTTVARVTTTTTVPRPGSPAVYEKIAAETDCSALQVSFDRAAATSDRGGEWRKLGIAYMEAADARMQAIDCYK